MGAPPGRQRSATQQGEAALVAGLVLLAALRVLAWTTAFPFFNGIDEHLHLDLVQKYSRGFLPGADDARFDAVSARLIVDWASPEYGMAPAEQPGGRTPTPAEVRATSPPGSPADRLALRSLSQRVNIEAHAPPLYYALAGGWLRAGRALGLDGLGLLSWLRAANALLLAAAVAGTWRGLRSAFPGDRLMRLGPPLLIAVWPNDLLYGITPDVLSLALGVPLFFGLLAIREGRGSEVTVCLAGLALGLAFLNKYSNVAWVPVAAVAALGARRGKGPGAGPRSAPYLIAFALAAALPVGWWLGRNLLVVGSLSGQASKLEWIGWSVQGVPGVCSHPLLAPAGWLVFLPRLAETFWRGEFFWHGQPAHDPVSDSIYVASSALFLALAALAWARGTWGRTRARPIEGLALLSVAAGVTTLAVLSTLFDYGLEKGPLSREFPYLASGRLVAAMVPAFSIACCRGIAYGCAWLPGRAARWSAWAILVALALVCLGAEWRATSSAFSSPWNLWNALLLG